MSSSLQRLITIVDCVALRGSKHGCCGRLFRPILTNHHDGVQPQKHCPRKESGIPRGREICSSVMKYNGFGIKPRQRYMPRSSPAQGLYIPILCRCLRWPNELANDKISHFMCCQSAVAVPQDRGKECDRWRHTHFCVNAGALESSDNVPWQRNGNPQVIMKLWCLSHQKWSLRNTWA